MSGDKDGGAGQDALLDPKRRPSQLFSEQRRASYGRGGGDMYANEFEKNVSIDTSKLNEFLFKLNLRFEAVERDVTEYMQQKADDAKEGKEALARELEGLNEELGGGDDDEDSMSRRNHAFGQTFSASSIEDKMEALRVVIGDITSAIMKLELDAKQRTRLQAAKDTAQDEILEMELRRLERQIEGKLSKAEIIESNKLQDHKMKSVEAVLMGHINSKTQDISYKLSSELDKVLDQLNNIQQAADASSRIMDDRIKHAISQAISRRDQSKDRRVQEELIAEVKALNQRNEELNARQMELEREVELQRSRISDLEAKPDVDVEQLTSDIMGTVEEKIEAVEDKLTEALSQEAEEVKADMEALETRIRQELEDKHSSAITAVDDVKDESSKELEAIKADLDEYRRDSRTEVERAFLQLQTLLEEKDKRSPPDVGPALAEAMEGLKTNWEENHRSILDRLAMLAEQLKAADDQMASNLRQSGEMVQALRDDVYGRLDEKKQALEAQISAKGIEMEHSVQNSHKTLTAMLKAATHDAMHKVEESDVANAEKRAGLLKDLHEVRHGIKQLGLKLLRPEAAAALGNDPSFADLASTVDLQRADIDFSHARLERSAIGLAELYRQIHGIVRGLATRDNHWATLDARLREHLDGMVNKCLEVQGEASSARPVALSREAKDYIATHAYRIAKIIAHKADYEVIRRIIGMRDPITEDDWDATVQSMRDKFLAKFITDIVAGSHKAYPAHEVPLLEARARFCDKVERAVKLAMSKFARINVVYTLFGKTRLDNTPVCVACDRPFSNDAGPGDRRAVCQDHLPCGSRAEKPSTAQSRTRDPAIADDLGSLGERSLASQVSRRSAQSHASSLSSATAVTLAAHSTSSSSLGRQLSGGGRKKMPVYRAGFKFPRSSSNTSLPLLYLDPSSSSHPAQQQQHESPSSSSQGPGGQQVGIGLVRVDEDYQVVGTRHMRTRPATVMTVGLGGESSSNYGLGSPSSVASNSSSIASQQHHHLPSLL